MATINFKYRAISGREVPHTQEYEGNNKAAAIRDLIMELGCGCTPVVEVEGIRVKPLRLSDEAAMAFLRTKYPR